MAKASSLADSLEKGVGMRGLLGAVQRA